MKQAEILTKQIAPCGANCTICMAYLKKTKSCHGCREDNINKPFHCIRCKIKNCEELKNNSFDFCFECSKFPCKRMKQLDNRYRTNYNYSMIDNLENIKKIGIGKFIEEEKSKWICSKCCGIISVHRGYCSDCGEIKFYHTGTKRKKIN
ncbi:DUF3795 domain-containing protein [Candidatus Gracilibacteria bacterium]|nr:DUF3795 domain-containing protein [Candidatus Gracilibacteria bacterium]